MEEIPGNGAPSSTRWRRERLMRIRSTSSVGDRRPPPIDVPRTQIPHSTEHSPLFYRTDSYGSVNIPPATTHSTTTKSFSLRFKHGFKPRLSNAFVGGLQNSTTPSGSPTLTRFTGERPISAYDAPLEFKSSPSSDDDLAGPQDEVELDMKTNGVRVWYSSFSSIDWLHDAIKDSARFARLRKRKSVKARMRLAFDRSLGWIIVTIVGFLTAIVAFLVVRSEQWLFDIKEGYCTTDWSMAKRFCCKQFDDSDIWKTNPIPEDQCMDWKTWAEAIGSKHEYVEYVPYAIIALTMALTSCLLTLYLTKSTSFVTRKESGVLSPHFNGSGASSSKSPQSEPRRKIMYYAAGSGIPEIKTILSGFVIHGYLGGRTLFTKSVGLALSVASGLSLGKEGPFVHIASCIGNIVSRAHSKYENNEGKRREILSAACAAGVAVAFGAPIGGTLFSLEEVSYYFPPKVMWRSFFCAMIAAITLRFLNPYGSGKLVLFQIEYDKDWHAYELLFFVFLGIIGGVYGAYFSKLNYRWSLHVRQRTLLNRHPVIEVLLVTLATTILCFLNPYTRMGGTELVYNLFAECKTGSGNTHEGLCVLDPSSFEHSWPVVRSILIAMVVKGALTVVTFGIKVPAGIFIPTLGVGACAGRVIGIMVQWLHYQYPDSPVFSTCGGDLDCVIPGLYAMVGAAAALSGVTRTTVSLAVIMLELTHSLTYCVPVMLAVLVAKTVADALEPKGIYDLVIELLQLPYLDTKHNYVWENVDLREVLDRDVDVIRLDSQITVESLYDQLEALVDSGNDDSGFPILRPDQHGEGSRMIGYIGANELEHALSIVAEEGSEPVFFRTTFTHDIQASSLSSLLESNSERTRDLFDFSIYMDQAPLTVQYNSPLEMVHQMFTKLGARYVVVTDLDGLYEGVIDKKTWLAFLGNKH